MENLGEFQLNRAHVGDCLELARRLPPESIDVIVTSPPYWGQRTSGGIGVEADPRKYLDALTDRLVVLKRALKACGLLWINLGDGYYSVEADWVTAMRDAIEARLKIARKAFEAASVPWLQYGNLLALPYRLTIALCDRGFLFRGEVVWRKANPMPEGKCRRPHRAHEGIYLFVKSERHEFQVCPPVKSVWEFPNEHPNGVRHFSRFPLELPKRCIEAYGKRGPEIVVLNPFSGSATTGVSAIALGCSYLGFEIDPKLAEGSNRHLDEVLKNGIAGRARQRRPRKLGQTLFEM